MADYYTPTVIQPSIPDADMTPLERLLLSHIFDAECDSDGWYFFSEQGPADMLEVGGVRPGRARRLQLVRVRDALVEAAQAAGDTPVARSNHWAFVPPKPVVVPSVKTGAPGFPGTDATGTSVYQVFHRHHRRV